MDELREKMSACVACNLRQKCEVVVGQGSHGAKVFLIAERPDREAELIGEPLASGDGYHFRRLLSQAGLYAYDFYVTYVNKCFSERKPTKDEIHTCSKWLWQEIAAVKPRVIVPLGAIPTCVTLKIPSHKLRLGDMVGKEHGSYELGTVVPWWSVNHIYQRGKAVDKETVFFFKNLMENLK